MFTIIRSRCVGGHEVPSSMQLAVVKEVGIGPLIQVSMLRKAHRGKEGITGPGRRVCVHGKEDEQRFVHGLSTLQGGKAPGGYS